MQAVKIRIKERFDSVIPYESLTYGEIINYMNQEALSLCSLLKINARIQNELKMSKKAKTRGRDRKIKTK